jgi:cobalt-zinc-cadmium efflux system outer membrane protein
VSLTQLLELGGKRTKRVAVARLDERVAAWEHERARLETAARTFKAFVAALLAQERTALAERLRDLARSSAAAVRRQVDAGAASPIEASRAEAALAAAEAGVGRREREDRAARSALGTLWGDPDPSITRLAGTLAPLPPPPGLADAQARVATTPDLARWDDVVARAEAGVALEAARRVPDVSVRLGARRFLDPDGNALVAEVSVPLPVFDRNTDAIAEARARVERARAEQRAFAIGAAAAVRAAHAEMAVAFEEADAIERRVLPRVRTALAETRRGYAAGGVRLLEVRDAERSLAEAEGTYLEALARYHTAAAELARLTGTAIARHAEVER